MKKKMLRRIWDVFSSILVGVVIIGGSIITYLFAKGYRINLTDITLRKTGVINVESIPTKCNLYIKEKYVGKTPKIVSPIDEGTVAIRLSKEGYNDWNKQTKVYSETSTSILPYLTLKDIQKETVTTIAQEIKEIEENVEKGFFIIVTEDKKEEKINLYKYETNKAFWTFNDNPEKIYSISSENVKTVDASLSQDGAWILLKITKTVNSRDTVSYSLIHLTAPNQVITETDLELFGPSYTISWSNDSTYLILESKQDIFSYKVEDSTKYLLLKKQGTSKYIYTSDSNGFFYYLTSKKEETVTKYSLLQQTLQGNGRKKILEDIYLQNSDKYIKEIREKESVNYIPITNSPENTRFGGEITNLYINQKTNGFFIQTTFASYWYDKDLQKYILIHPHPSDFVALSKDASKLIFYDGTNKQYGVFSFFKDELDKTTNLGTKLILKNVEADGITEVKWIDQLTNISYTQGETIKVIDVDGENINPLTTRLSKYIIDDEAEYLYQITTNTAGEIEIVRFRIS